MHNIILIAGWDTHPIYSAAVVTDAGRGLGKQFARILAYEGAKVSICGRLEADLAEARRQKDTGCSIINLGSRAGVEGSVNHAAYDAASNPFNRYGDPYSDVAPVVAFPASDDSKWMTGQTLHVEGGRWMRA